MQYDSSIVNTVIANRGWNQINISQGMLIDATFWETNFSYQLGEDPHRDR